MRVRPGRVAWTHGCLPTEVPTLASTSAHALISWLEDAADATEALFDAFNRFGSDLASFDDTTFSWYQAAATMSADPVHRRLAAEEEARRKAGPLRPDEDDGHLPRLESDPR